MAYQRKLGRTAAQRKALLRNQVTNLIWYGRIETTLARAKEVRSVAEHLITLAIRECDNNVSVEKTFNNDKGQSVTVTVPPESMMTTGIFARVALATGATSACESSGARTIPLTRRVVKFSTTWIC